MKKGRLALNINGQMTYCTATEENIGKGRCNHLLHQLENETEISFVNRLNQFISENKNKIKKEYPKTEAKGIKYPIQVSCLKALSKELSDPDDIEFYDDAIDSLYRYAKAATEHRRKYLELKDNDDNAFVTEERFKVERLRSNAHNVAMSSLRVLNVMCDEHNIPHVYPGDIKNDNRDKIAESIFYYAGKYEELSN